QDVNNDEESSPKDEEVTTGKRRRSSGSFSEKRLSFDGQVASPESLPTGHTPPPPVTNETANRGLPSQNHVTNSNPPQNAYPGAFVYSSYPQPLYSIPYSMYQPAGVPPQVLIPTQTQPAVIAQPVKLTTEHSIQTQLSSRPPPPMLTFYTPEQINAMRTTIGEERDTLTVDDELLIFEFLSGKFNHSLPTKNVVLNEKKPEIGADGLSRKEILSMSLDYQSGKWQKLRKRTKEKATL
ncbi:hypothetical protein HK096_002211, partial [Nowakowskiella sp. JEL0078]